MVVLERPREEGHGDFATSAALRLAKPLARPPREIADEIVRHLGVPNEVVAKVEIAGPGFINFWLSSEQITSVLETILKEGGEYGTSDVGRGRKVNVEFVSANPTGPLHVGHGRGAALGDAIASLLEATGHDVVREFYVNDAGVQIDRLAESLWERVQQAVGKEANIPEGGYKGEYLIELAGAILMREGSGFADLDKEEGLRQCRSLAVEFEREEQDRDLNDFGVKFDVVFSEKSLYANNEIEKTLAKLRERDVVYEKDGAVWLATSRYGDAKDRVLKKQDGTYTYFMPDIAYHLTKAERDADLAIDVWGADHHGYIARMRAALTAMGLPEDFLKVVLVQLVKVLRDGEEVRFSKRSGDFVTLRELFEETGVDAARYFFLMRRGDSQFVFDVDLALKQTEENPVYYVQYAHTRMAGIFRNAGVSPDKISAEGEDLSVLDAEDEVTLMKHLGSYPVVIKSAAESLEPQKVISYVDELARLVNGWYHRHRVIGSSPNVEGARLVLARAAQTVLANALKLLGITAPERM